MQASHVSKRIISKEKIVVSGWRAALVAAIWMTQSSAYAQSDAEILESVRACQNVPGLSLRLACYDRVLPPNVEAIEGAAPSSAPGMQSRPAVSGSAATAREEELQETVAELEEQLQRETIDTTPTARIIEVQRPSVRTSRLIAEDGRVFVESVSTSIIRWPETPFDVEVNRSVTGTISLRAIGVERDRGLGRGIRVTQER